MFKKSLISDCFRWGHIPDAEVPYARRVLVSKTLMHKRSKLSHSEEEKSMNTNTFRNPLKIPTLFTSHHVTVVLTSAARRQWHPHVTYGKGYFAFINSLLSCHLVLHAYSYIVNSYPHVFPILIRKYEFAQPISVDLLSICRSIIKGVPSRISNFTFLGLDTAAVQYQLSGNLSKGILWSVNITKWEIQKVLTLTSVWRDSVARFTW